MNQPGSEAATGAGRHRANVGSAEASSSQPLLRIIAGNPSPEEVAAVTVVLTAITGGGGDGPAQPKASIGGWADPAAGLRRPLRSGPGGWRASARS
jgi:hypothetical protein